MSDEDHPGLDIVCPPWNEQDHRFAARHYAAWQRKCRLCGCDVSVSRQQKKQADADNLQYICQQCSLLPGDNTGPG
jgi:hypothetical protein